MAALVVPALMPAALRAQAVVFRDPGSTGGVQLADLPAGAAPTLGQTRGDWTEVTLQGWVRSAAVSPSTRDGYDLVVNVRAGETLRAAPNAGGAGVGRLRYGVLLRRVAEQNGWIQVRRTGWIQRSAAPAKPAPTKPAPTPAAASGKPAQTAKPAGVPAESTASAAPAASPPAPAAASAASASGDRVELAANAPIYAAPGAGTLGTLQRGASGRTVGQTGEWVKVQLEGWVRESDLKAAAGGALVGVTAAEVRANPDRFVGQTVEWRVQYISLQTADQLRPELPQGQPYLLVRGPLPEAGFVYVSVRRDQLPQVRTLQPLQELVVRGVLRAAQTRYLPTPVLELVSLRTAEAAAQ
ncbi:MAG TPA: SH3 domain-containing protein [Gemmatimonadales bacterium]|nr:SH3 domain-containing protein [Gemmatimonadales bacterium]